MQYFTVYYKSIPYLYQPINRFFKGRHIPEPDTAWAFLPVMTIRATRIPNLILLMTIGLKSKQSVITIFDGTTVFVSVSVELAASSAASPLILLLQMNPRV